MFLSSFLPKHGIGKASSLLLIFVFLLSPLQSRAQPNPDSRGDPYGYARFSPSMAVIVVVLVAALFFMGFFSIYIRNCTDSSNGGSLNPLPGIGGRSRRAARGLDASVIETFPTMVYSEVKGHKIGKGALECAVCLSEFEDHETLRLIPKCDHVFHTECIDEWLASHTTCPVCRANLSPEQGGDAAAATQATEFATPDSDLEAQLQHDAAESDPEDEQRGHAVAAAAPPAVEVIDVNQTLNRNRTRGSRSSRTRKFPRSHSTGHSLVQPGENTDRFTLRLPVDVRKEIMNRQLKRATSLLVLPRETSSRRGYRTGGEGSGRGRRFDKTDRMAKSDRWVFSMTPPFFNRALSIKSPKVAANVGEGSSARPAGGAGDSSRPPV